MFRMPRGVGQRDHPTERVSDKVEGSESQATDHLLEIRNIIRDRVAHLRIPLGLPVPTMIGASFLEITSNYAELMSGASRVGWDEIAVGFVVSFIVALVVIRAFVAYVGRAGFSPFAWYRIVIGLAAIVWLSFS